VPPNQRFKRRFVALSKEPLQERGIRFRFGSWTERDGMESPHDAL
jgi:hypothetical protein